MEDEELSDFLSDVTDSSEDEFEQAVHEPRMKNKNYLDAVVPEYSEIVFFEHFRLSKNTANDISIRFENSQYYNSQLGQYGNIPALHQVLIYLWYMGHQTASYRDVADRFDVTISSINRLIYRVTCFLSHLSPEMIKWPNEAEKHASEEHFRNNGFPNVIGAIDGSHIKIDKPVNDSDSYINRKSCYSIQMQVVCDHRRKIIDVFVGYPGSVHDSRVFRNSPIGNTLNEKCGRFFLLGDSGYPLRCKLLTPYKNRGNLTLRQQNYNLKLSSNRYVIEHCFGLLKQKFRQMYHLKLRNIRLMVHFIRAACVLHNITLEDNFPINNEEGLPNANGQEHQNIDMQNDDDVDNEIDQVARVVRDRVANGLAM